MDALSLVLPASPIANPAANGADTASFAPEGESQSVDFAALLAAGLMPQQDPATALPLSQAEAQASDGEAEAGEATAGAADTLLAALPHPMHAALMAAAAPEPHADPSDAAIDAAQPNASSGQAATALAATAATIADAAGSEHAMAAGDGAAQSVSALESSTAPDPASTDTPTELIAPQLHPLHMPSTEPVRLAHPTAVLDVSAPVQAPEFAQALSQQVVWMADKDAQVAELRINPPELGPVEVRLHLSGDEASVQFASAHAEVRSAIEAAIARLRESMAQAGIQLGEASVSAESFREQASQHFGNGGQGGSGRASTHEIEPAWQRAPIAEGVRRGLVDLFA